jgi:flagellar M-ring protein FliF
LGEQTEDGVAQVIPAVTEAPQVSQYEENMAMARRLAREDPKLVANVVRQWMAVNE